MEVPMQNVHDRVVASPPELVRPWIEASWSGTARDPFPRDVLPSWRSNPPDAPPLALIPGVTRVGHGPFACRFEGWDGERWRVRAEGRFRGWHGFDIHVTERGCRLTHTIEVDLGLLGGVLWYGLIAPAHDWCVEAIFDRVEEAARTGEMPAVTRRRMPPHAAASFAVLGCIPARILRAVVSETRGRSPARLDMANHLSAVGTPTAGKHMAARVS
jgi:hypothetical protein